MDPIGDLDLLREFVEHRSDAFAELVARHVDMVYAAALRQVRDRHMAEDVTQAVFLILMHKAPSIRPPTILAGWLLNAARFAARDALKSARRRRNHEQQAARQKAELMVDHPAHFAPELSENERIEVRNQIDAILDGALARLGGAGRDAIALRFFKNLSFAEVGRQLGISEQAAKQRVFRATERLRGILSGKDVNLPAEYLSVALSQCAVHAAPHGLRAAIAGAASKAVAISPSSMAIAKGAIKAMAWTKTKIIAGSLLLLLFGTASVTTIRHLQHVSRDVLAVDAATAQPPPTNAPASTEPRFTFWQSPPPTPKPPYSGPPIIGDVFTAGGKPVAGATILFSVSGNGISISMTGVPASTAPRVSTNAAGHFSFRPNAAPIGLVVSCPQGYAWAHLETPVSPMRIILQPWSHILATVMTHGAPAVGAPVTLQLVRDGTTDSSDIYFEQMSTTADENGRVAVDHVIPLAVDLGLPLAGRNTVQHWYRIALQKDGSTPITVGGAGRPVVARIIGPISNSDYRQFDLSPVLPGKFREIHWETLTAAERAPLSEEMEKSPEMREWWRTADSKRYSTRIDPDGAIRLEDVSPGEYALRATYASNTANQPFETIAELNKIVTIPGPPGQQSNVPVDLGNLQLEYTPRLQPGRQVPPLTGTDSLGHSFNLSDHRGKYLLLDLQYSRESNSSYEGEEFRALCDRFACNPRFFFTTVYFHPVVGPSASSPSENLMPCVMADERALPREYANAAGTTCLVDPAGNLVWKQRSIQISWYALDKFVANLPTSTQPVQIQIEHIPPAQATLQTPYRLVPPPSSDDAATDATFTIVDGTPPKIANALNNLHDGRNANGEDDRRNNFLFAIGTLEGRIAIDLKRQVSIANINTYSWHKDTRAPQVYTVYGSNAATPSFNPKPRIGINPATCGWTPIASVDTRPQTGPPGGRYAVSISAPDHSLGTYRYLLFEIFPTETIDPYGHTFYSEIDVVAAK